MHASKDSHQAISATRRLLLASAACTFLTFSPTAFAQTQPIRLIVPFPAGGPTDLGARVVAQKVAEIIGQSIVIDNRPGAGGVIGTDAAAKSKPDGQTIMLGTAGTLGINASLYSKLPYDPVKDFAPIAMVLSSSNVLLVPAQSPIKSFAGWLSAAKAAPPGKLTMGSAGNGTTPHLGGAMLNKMAGIQTTHVPYKGSAPMLTDLIGGQLDYSIDAVSTALPFIRSGKLRPLAVTTAARAKALSDVPTVAESGFPGYEVGAWVGFFAPAGTSQSFIQHFNTATNQALLDPAVRAKLEEMSSNPIGGSPAQAGEAVRREVTRWPDLVKEAGARID